MELCAEGDIFRRRGVVTPAWVPLHAMWGYPVGPFLVLAGAALLINIKPRIAACWIGVLMTLPTALLCLRILALTRDPSQMTDAINFIADKLMFGGMALLVAEALPWHSRPEETTCR